MLSLSYINKIPSKSCGFKIFCEQFNSESIRVVTIGHLFHTLEIDAEGALESNFLSLQEKLSVCIVFP